VGVAYGVPALKYEKKTYPAEALSRRLEGDALPLEGRWVERKTLEALGIGPLGRFINGEPIRPIKLKAPELMRRGGAGLEGFWPDFEFESNPWVASAEEETVFKTHLDFLRTFGVSGGLVLGDFRQGARFLAAYLSSLKGRIEDGTVLVLMGEKYYASYMSRVLSPDTAAAYTEEGLSVFSPLFRGIGVGFYEQLPGNLKIARSNYDILILTAPEEVLGGRAPENRCRELREIRARLKLGLLFNGQDLVSDPCMNDLKNFFGLRGAMGEIAGSLFRRLDEFVPLPRKYRFKPWAIKSPCSVKTPRFTVKAKFQGIRTPEFKEELDCFFAEGASAPIEAPRADYETEYGRDLRFGRLTKEQKAFFLYWRGAFRKGRPLKTQLNYIRLYARELILSMGNAQAPHNFRELLRLWRSCREETPLLDSFFPQWLTDFAVLYALDDKALEELLPYTEEGNLPLWRDTRLHRRYIQEDNPITFEDIIPLLGKKGPGPVPASYAEAALNALDRHMREKYQKRLFEFFYPSRLVSGEFNAFTGLGDLGYSAYTAEWIQFHAHPALRVFLREVMDYIAFRLQAVLPGKRKEPPLEAEWKKIICEALGFPENLRPPIILEAEKVKRLRHESDKVRDLLAGDMDEAAGEARKGAPETGAVFPRRDPPALPPPESPASGEGMASFLRGLNPAETEALRIIAGDGGPETRTALEELARKNHTMPELLLDGLNGAFQERFGDLLIDTQAPEPALQAEYAETLRNFLRQLSY
jgi:hypothetical protein